jgi:hypothetical protein
MSKPYQTYILGKDAYEVHPCVTKVKYVPLLGYEITIIHKHIIGGVCIDCREYIKWKK